MFQIENIKPKATKEKTAKEKPTVKPKATTEKTAEENITSKTKATKKRKKTRLGLMVEHLLSGKMN